jgi:hypothetical protein
LDTGANEGFGDGLHCWLNFQQFDPSASQFLC